MARSFIKEDLLSVNKCGKIDHSLTNKNSFFLQFSGCIFAEIKSIPFLSLGD